jgi:type IV secretion system protein VirB8
MDEAVDYYAEARRWEADERRDERERTRLAAGLAMTALLVCMALSVALVLLLPLKRTEPYLVRVDSSSGVVDVVPRYVGTADLPESVLRYLLTTYVTLRERYVPGLVETDYDEVGAFQAAAMNQTWAQYWARTNPESPLNRHRDGSRVTVQIRSVTLLRHGGGAPDVAQVRFRRSTLPGAGAAEHTDDWVATLSTTFGPPSEDLRTRTLNPLGFRVLEYRREPEVTESTSGVSP